MKSKCHHFQVQLCIATQVSIHIVCIIHIYVEQDYFLRMESVCVCVYARCNPPCSPSEFHPLQRQLFLPPALLVSNVTVMSRAVASPTRAETHTRLYLCAFNKYEYA